jgi:NADH:ubiquinone oxidoreductase subunit F (NADH-binding)/(2Fe-2S) ferredoxin
MACISSDSEGVLDAFQEGARERGLADQVEIIPTGCMGLCSLGPLVRVEVRGQAPVLYKEMNPLLARLVMSDHIAPALAQKDSESFKLPAFFNDHTLSLDDPFFSEQTLVVLRESGHIDPGQIEQYIACGGYHALEQVLTSKTPEEVIQCITDSGLRGRGGGGFPTGTKWAYGRASQAVDGEKFIICNGDEGDPGAYMDRAILEGNPHSVLEGMLIGAYAIGAPLGWYYIRAEYPLAVERVEKAIRQARKYGLLGKNILGTGFSFDCEIRLGAGAFVCGEETALIHSIEGQRGTPRSKPPYPSVHGLWGRPTCVNNVETLANIPKIIQEGPEWFRSMGTETSAGTKVFALTGKVEHSGLIEVPMGYSLRDIVDRIGGGTTGKALKALQTGGPSGGVIPEEKLDVPVCYEELKKLGSIMGSGGMIVLDEEDSMVQMARFYLGFTVDESCGKCAPCRIGGTQMRKLLDKVISGDSDLDDLDTLKRLARAMQRASLCGLGQTAPNPVVSTLKYFEKEYMDYIKPEHRDKREWHPKGSEVK